MKLHSLGLGPDCFRLITASTRSQENRIRSTEAPLILRTRKLKVKRERNRERKKDRKKVQRGVQAPSGGAVDSQWQEAGAGGSGARGERLHADAVEESVPGATEAGRA